MDILAASLVALTLVVEAPASLAPAADRIRAIDRQALAEALRDAGLPEPETIRIALVPEGDEAARTAPPWVVGLAFGSQDVVIFPARVTRYPYDSLEGVTRHEIVHLSLTTAAGGRPLPRWFHEGVATTVEAGWTVPDQFRLLFAALRDPTVGDLSGLFRSRTRPETEIAYRLAAALVHDLRDRHGATLPGRLAARVAGGMPFDRAFVAETGETADAAAARAWAGYRRWTAWLPALASGTTLWTFILGLAGLAFLARRRRRAARRRLWDEEDAESRRPWDT